MNFKLESMLTNDSFILSAGSQLFFVQLFETVNDEHDTSFSQLSTLPPLKEDEEEERTGIGIGMGGSEFQR